MKRSLQPLRHANRREHAADVIREFTSPSIKRSPFSFGDAFKGIKDGIGKAVDVVGDGVGKAIDGAGKAADVVGDGIGKAVDTVGNGVDKAADKVVDKVVDGAKEAGKIIDKATGAVIGFVDAVCTHRVSPLIDTDHQP